MQKAIQKWYMVAVILVVRNSDGGSSHPSRSCKSGIRSWNEMIGSSKHGHYGGLSKSPTYHRGFRDLTPASTNFPFFTLSAIIFASLLAVVAQVVKQNVTIGERSENPYFDLQDWINDLVFSSGFKQSVIDRYEADKYGGSIVVVVIVVVVVMIIVVVVILVVVVVAVVVVVVVAVVVLGVVVVVVAIF